MKLTQKDVEREARMIGDVCGWPFIYFLPMKKYVEGKGYQFGVVEFGRMTRVLCLDKDQYLKATAEQLFMAKAYMYSTVEAMVQDGWMVD